MNSIKDDDHVGICPVCGVSVGGQPACLTLRDAVITECWFLEKVLEYAREEADLKRHIAKFYEQRLTFHDQNPTDPLRTRPDPGAQTIPAPTAPPPPGKDTP